MEEDPRPRRTAARWGEARRRHPPQLTLRDTTCVNGSRVFSFLSLYSLHSLKKSEMVHAWACRGAPGVSWRASGPVRTNRRPRFSRTTTSICGLKRHHRRTRALLLCPDLIYLIYSDQAKETRTGNSIAMKPISGRKHVAMLRFVACPGSTN